MGNPKNRAGETPALPAIKYSDNPDFLGQAFSLFCKGMSCAAIVSALRPDWIEVSERTVQRIAKDMGWEKSRASFLKYYMDAAASAEGLLPNVILSLEKLRMKMDAAKYLDTKDIYAYRQLCEDLLVYTGKHPRFSDTPLAISSDDDLEAMLKAIREDDVLGGIWKRRRVAIEKAYRGNLDELKSKSKSDKVSQRSATNTGGQRSASPSIHNSRKNK